MLATIERRRLMIGRRRPIHRFGTAFAFFALWLQFVLSFGHMHAEDFFPPQAGTSPSDARATAEWQAPASPARRAPLAPDHDDCAICVSMAMVATGATPPPVPLPPPPAFVRATYLLVPAPFLAARPHLHFRARAPPRF